MSTAGYRLRKRKQGLFYGIPPAPWQEPKPRTHSGTSTTKDKSRKARSDLVTAEDHKKASSTTTNVIIDDTPSTIFHESDDEAKIESSGATLPFKRARSATVQGDDDEEALDDGSPLPLQKRRRHRMSSRVYTSTPSPASKTAENPPLDLSPATEAAIREIPNEIKKSIKTLKMIRRYVDGLLDFKAILDYRQVELDERLKELERRDMLAADFER